jgi:hypothetical protein
MSNINKPSHLALLLQPRNFLLLRLELCAQRLHLCAQSGVVMSEIPFTRADFLSPLTFSHQHTPAVCNRTSAARALLAAPSADLCACVSLPSFSSTSFCKPVRDVTACVVQVNKRSEPHRRTLTKNVHARKPSNRKKGAIMRTDLP